MFCVFFIKQTEPSMESHFVRSDTTTSIISSDNLWINGFNVIYYSSGKLLYTDLGGCGWVKWTFKNSKPHCGVTGVLDVRWSVIPTWYCFVWLVDVDGRLLRSLPDFKGIFELGCELFCLWMLGHMAARSLFVRVGASLKLSLLRTYQMDPEVESSPEPSLSLIIGGQILIGGKY